MGTPKCAERAGLRLTWQAFFGTMIAAVVAKLAKTGFTTINASGSTSQLSFLLIRAHI